MEVDEYVVDEHETVVKCVDSENNVCDTNLSVPGTDSVVCHDVEVCSKGGEVSISSPVWEVIIEHVVLLLGCCC
jgi:hypothetical protein